MLDLDFLLDPGPPRWVVVEEHRDGTLSVYGPFDTENEALEYEWDLRAEGGVRHWTALLRRP